MSKPKGSVSKKIEQKLKDYFAKIKILNDKIEKLKEILRKYNPHFYDSNIL